MKFLNILIILFLFSLTSCATFSNKITFENQVKLNKNTLSKINGFYETNSVKSIVKYQYSKPKEIENDTVNRYPLYSTLQTNDGYATGSVVKLENYSTKIEVQDKSKIVITYLDKDKIIDKVILKYKLKNGYLYLKNNNFKTKLIPGLCGNFEVNRTRIGLNSENNLIMNHSHYLYGAILFIIGDTKKSSFAGEYKRKI